MRSSTHGTATTSVTYGGCLRPGETMAATLAGDWGAGTPGPIRDAAEKDEGLNESARTASVLPPLPPATGPSGRARSRRPWVTLREFTMKSASNWISVAAGNDPSAAATPWPLHDHSSPRRLPLRLWRDRDGLGRLVRIREGMGTDLRCRRERRRTQPRRRPAPPRPPDPGGCLSEAIRGGSLWSFRGDSLALETTTAGDRSRKSPKPSTKPHLQLGAGLPSSSWQGAGQLLM